MGRLVVTLITTMALAAVVAALIGFGIKVLACGIVGMDRRRMVPRLADDQGEDGWHDQQRREGREDKATDDGSAERGLHLAAFFQR